MRSTAVFVHGVMETAAVWRRLQQQLPSPSIALELPGFGTSLPAGFLPSKEAYADWLINELHAMDGPVDLVGHDWGALLALRVATGDEVRLRSWTVDVAGVFHPDYVWHPWAASLLLPGAGEAVLAQLRTSAPDDPAGAARFLTGLGVPQDAALDLADANDETMSQCILGLYRSAVPNVSASWGAAAQQATRSPGMVLVPTEDRIEDEVRSREVAERLGARVELLAGFRHWWMYDTSGLAAKTLMDFWAGVGGT